MRNVKLVRLTSLERFSLCEKGVEFLNHKHQCFVLVLYCPEYSVSLRESIYKTTQLIFVGQKIIEI